MVKNMIEFLTTVNKNKMQSFSILTNSKRGLSIFDQCSYINYKGSNYSTGFFPEA